MCFSRKVNIFSLVITSYGLMLSCMRSVHLALLYHSTPDYVSRNLTIKHGMPEMLYDAEESCCVSLKIVLCSFGTLFSLDNDCIIAFIFKLLANCCHE